MRRAMLPLACLAMLCSAWSQDSTHDDESKPKFIREADPNFKPKTGERAEVDKSGAFAVTNLLFLDDMQNAILAGDMAGLTKMAQSGQVVPLDAASPLLVLGVHENQFIAKGRTVIEARVTGGKHDGVKVYLFADYVVQMVTREVPARYSRAEWEREKARRAGPQVFNQGFPSIAGRWREVQGIEFTVRQSGSRFTAETTYQHPEAGMIRATVYGEVAKDGTIKATLRHTKAPKGWKSQRRTGTLAPHGGTIIGKAEWDGGSHEFLWSRID